MRRPPRSVDEPLYNRSTLGLSLLQGSVVLAILIFVFLVTLARGLSEGEARAMTFTTVVLANLSLVFTNRSWSETILATLRRPNRSLWWVSGATVLALIAVLYVPVLRGLFHFSILHAIDLAICLCAAVASIVWFEALKAWKRHRNTK